MSKEDSETSRSSNKMSTWIKRKIAKLKKKPRWHTFTQLFTFAVHFFVVMSLLFCGALALAWLEDYDVMFGADELQNEQQTLSTTAALTTTNSDAHEHQTNDLLNKTKFWTKIENKYNITFHESSRKEFLAEITEFLHFHEGLEDEHDEEEGHHQHNGHTHTRDKKFVFMKWYYFVIIASTTIGYGHVYPKTDNGKLFYILFSILGIVLMMTLLRSCGKIIMAINKKFYTLVRRLLCGEKEYMSDQFTSVLSLCFIFLIFMMLVVWHDKTIGEVEDWSWTDTFYFWLVTFTTVGFGDVHFPLEVEVEHFYELIFYRVVGLSFLAGIIESIHEYIKYRKSMLLMKHNKKRLLRKVTGQKKLIKERYYRKTNGTSTSFLLE